MFGVYIHIPFCSHRCPFCDFTVVTESKNNFIEDYVTSLITEIGLVDRSAWPAGTLTSVYFGGGTPSLISSLHLQKITSAILEKFSTNEHTEITIEVNPEDVVEKKSKDWRSCGINRISLGVQAMDDAELLRLGRHHKVRQVESAFHILRNAGFSNISMDLMFGLENQTVHGWKTTIEKALALQPDHLSTYNLTIEKNTAYEKQHHTGKLILPSDDAQADMMIETKKILANHGYDPYEISNAAKPGFESRHNLLYWTGKPYLGLGVSAHSFHKNKAIFQRWSNHKNIPQYQKMIRDRKLPIDQHEEIDHDTHVEERLMTGLRLRKGLDLEELKNTGLTISPKIIEQIQILKTSGHLQQTDQNLFITPSHLPMTSEILVRLLESVPSGHLKKNLMS